jgi:hypothetical protein
MTTGNSPIPHPHFSDIGLNGVVHLRLKGETVDDAPTYADARLTGVFGEPGDEVANFYLESLGRNIIGITEVQYDAWPRY